ncbi:MAG: hypothetical protein AAF970_06935 [Bacteroidota bacterium]
MTKLLHPSMRRLILRRLRLALLEKEGGMLMQVLVLIVLFSGLVGLILLLHLMQYRFIRQDVHRARAEYLAEAGVYAMMDHLQRDPTAWAGVDTLLSVRSEGDVRVQVEPFGGYLWLRATSRVNRSRAVLQALVGQRPGAPYETAIYQWDTESSLNVAGEAHVKGDVVVGPRGLITSSFRGFPFTGSVDGTVFTTPDLEPPVLDLTLLEVTLAQGLTLLAAPPPNSALSLPEGIPPLLQEQDVHVVPGDLILGPADSLFLASARTVVATGTIEVVGPLSFAPGVRLIAGETMRLSGQIVGRDGLFIGREGVDLRGVRRCSGQFLSPRLIRVAGATHLDYPSVLYVGGEATDVDGGLVLADQAQVDGIVVHPPLEEEPVLRRGRIIVGDQAQVRGAIVNGHETELHGLLEGTLLTYQLYFYDSPSDYVNWLRDATVDVSQRPLEYLVPLGLGAAETPRLHVLRWYDHHRVDRSSPT